MNNDCNGVDDDYQREVDEPIIPNLTYTKGYCLVVTTAGGAYYVQLSTGAIKQKTRTQTHTQTSANLIDLIKCAMKEVNFQKTLSAPTSGIVYIMYVHHVSFKKKSVLNVLKRFLFSPHPHFLSMFYPCRFPSTCSVNVP